MLVVSHELAVAIFAFVVLFSVVGLTVLDYIATRAVGADDHCFGVSLLTR